MQMIDLGTAMCNKNATVYACEAYLNKLTSSNLVRQRGFYVIAIVISSAQSVAYCRI